MKAQTARIIPAPSTPVVTAPDSHESRFITASRLLMICGLVWHHLFEIPGSAHSPRLSMQNVTHFVPELLNSFVHMAMMTAVPVLSIVSGFLFFRRSELDYGHLLSSRLRTVALPTWLWSALWFGFGWALYTLARSGGWLDAPGLNWLNYGSGNVGSFDDVGAMTLLNGIFALSQPPFAFQFWFVHDLLITILLAPALFFFLRILGWRLLVLMAVFWLLIPDPPLLFSGNVPMFFAIGAWLTLPQSAGLGATLTRLERYRWLLAGLFTLALLIRIFSHEFANLDAALQSHAHLCLLRVLGVLTIAALISRHVSGQHATAGFFARYGCYAFFIFAAHYPLIELVQIGVEYIPGHSSAIGMLLSWVLVPVVTIGIAIAIATTMERHLPALFGVLNGGRSSRPVPSQTVASVSIGSARTYGTAHSIELNDPAPDTR